MIALFVASFALIAFCKPVQTPPQIAPAPARAEIWNTEQFTLTSTVLGRDVLIQVAKPMQLQTGPVPAVYLLDGNLIFPTVVNAGALPATLGQLGPAYFIGVGYPEQDVGQWSRERGRDLIHVDLTGRPEGANVSSGEGARFERFLIQELKPAVEARYGVDPDRAVLAGNSLGGLFAAHVLINNPEAFRDYIIGSPSLWAEPGLADAAAALAGRKRSGKVFIGVGANETATMTESAGSLAANLQAGAPGIEVRYVVFPEENHFSVAPGLYRRALSFILPPSPLPAVSD